MKVLPSSTHIRSPWMWTMGFHCLQINALESGCFYFVYQFTSITHTHRAWAKFGSIGGNFIQRMSILASASYFQLLLTFFLFFLFWRFSCVLCESNFQVIHFIVLYIYEQSICHLLPSKIFSLSKFDQLIWFYFCAPPSQHFNLPQPLSCL